MRQKLLIIGSGDFQLPLAARAAKEDLEVLIAGPVVDERYDPYVSKKCIADVRDREKILAFAKEEKIDGVITDQTDIAVRTVAWIAEQLGLPGNGYETSCLFTDKSAQRAKLAELGIKQLPNKTVHSLEEGLAYYAELGGTVIIKPHDSQGSRGVQIVENEEMLREKYAEAARWSTDDGVIIERYATGREFVIEGICYNYEFKNLGCGDTLYFDIPDVYAGKNRIFPTSADDELAQRALDLNAKIITGFGMKQGLTQTDMIMDGDDLYLVETAARGGGVWVSSDLAHYYTGVDIEGFLINIALGRQQGLPEFTPGQSYVGYEAFYLPVGEVVHCEGVEEVVNLPYVHHNTLYKLHNGLVTKNAATDKTARIAFVVTGEDRVQLWSRMYSIRRMLDVKVRTPQGKIVGLIWE